jgi:hypothetical protein
MRKREVEKTNWRQMFVTVTLVMLSTLALATPAFAENVRQVGGRGLGNWWENLSVESEFHLEIQSIKPVSPLTVEVENMCISKLTIKVKEEVSNAGLTIQQLAAENFLPPRENFTIPRENFTTPGMSVIEGFQNLGYTRTYRYFKFIVRNMTDDQIENVIIEFGVEKSWISRYSIDKKSITLSRLENKLVEITAPWGESTAMERQVMASLPTEKVGEDATHIYFSAVSSGFSYFAITGRSVEGPSENSPGNGNSSGVNLVGVAMMTVIAVLIGVLFYWRKKFT